MSLSLMTNSVCWWCCHGIYKDALQMPKSYNQRRDTFVLKGVYCSWECMKAHCCTGSSEHHRGYIGGNMILLRKRMYGRGIPHGPIRPAPHFSKLKMFGGDMEIDEFRKCIKPDEGDAITNIPSEKGMSSIVATQATTNRDDNKMWEINNSVSTNEPLKLKRQKPLPRDQNNLASMLGLKKLAK